MLRRSPRLLFLALLALALPQLGGVCGETETLPGLSAPVEVVTDQNGVRHLTAQNDLDLARAAGVIHARDRFLQMDLTRREASGDLAELVGPSALSGDVQNRTIGLRRAAERTAAQLPPEQIAILEAYAEGVNHVLANEPLPPEYAALEITEARPWTVADSLVIGRAIAASLSLDIDIFLTLDFQAFIQAGIANGFDGQTLFSEDLVRSAPMHPAATVPDATDTTPYLAKAPKLDVEMLARAAEGAERVRQELAEARATSRLLEPVMERRETHVGSNEWGVAAEHSKSGFPMIANDPHLSLNMPSTFYEWHLTVVDDPDHGPMNVNGVGFPGTPGVILGQNERITWGATTNPMDVSDVFQDELHVFSPNCPAGALACIHSDGAYHPVTIELPTYRFNAIGDGIPNNLQTASLPLEQSVIGTVEFRSFGPILDIADPSVLSTGGVTTALVLQYVGFHATRELLTFQKWNRAQNLADFQDGLADYDVGSQNWAYADVDGNLAYFTSGELPLRKDLEQGTVHGGVPPYLIRDGSGPANWVPDPARSQGQTIPFAVMPMEEMPHTINPENGFFVNANNDPAGTTLDNNPLNQVRPSKPTAIYYLNPGYADGLRAGRITQLVEDAISAGNGISLQDMREFQMNTQMLDAELMLPFLMEAFDAASAPGAPPALAALAADPGVAEAIGRLAQWDYSSPTGIPEGYDASDESGERLGVTTHEAQMSVASTLWNVWRGQAVRGVIDARLSDLGAPGVGSRDAYKALHHLLSQTPYTGVGASGVDFIPEPAALTPEQRRDLALLQAMRDALDRLAGPAFATAFGNSTNQDDYRWGMLHRITFDHPLDASLSVPPQNGFDDLAPGLRGVSRDGGYEIVNASGFSSRADNENAFRFGGGPVRRYTGAAAQLGPLEGILGHNVIPGGPSGIPGDPGTTTQLGDWLTGETHPVNMGPALPVPSGSKLTFEP